MVEDKKTRFRQVFGRDITPEQDEGYERILRRAKSACFGPSRDTKIAYILATAWWESAMTLQPVREGLAQSDADARAHVNALFENGRMEVNYALPAENGQSFYGRGLVQMTWEDNYKAMGDHLIGDRQIFYDQPDRVLDPELSAIILVRGMLDGIFTNHRLDEFINAQQCDFVRARQVVNRMDRAETIASFAEKFFYVLTGKSEA